MDSGKRDRRIAKALSSLDTHVAIWHDSGKWRLTTSPNCSFLLEQTKAGELRRLVCPTGTDGAVLALQDRTAGESLGVGIIDNVSELIPLYHRYQHLRTLHRRLDTQ